MQCRYAYCFSFFFYNDTATTDIYTRKDTLSLHDALPISIDRDALAFLQAAIWSRDGKCEPRIAFPVSRFPRRFSDAPYRAYYSGKHSRRSKTNNVSEPSGRRSTATQRGASASGNAGTPGKAGTPPSPSHTGACTQYNRSTSPSARSFVPSAPPPSHNN